MANDSFRNALDTAALPVGFDPMLDDYAAMVGQVETAQAGQDRTAEWVDPDGAHLRHLDRQIRRER